MRLGTREAGARVDLHSNAVAAVFFNAHFPLHKSAVSALNVTLFQIIREISADAQAPAGAAAAHAGQRSEMAGVLLLEALKQRRNYYYLYRGLDVMRSIRSTAPQ